LSRTFSSRARGFTALGLMLVLVLGLVGSGLIAYRQSHLTDKPYSFSNGGIPIPDVAQSDEVLKIATAFVLRNDTFDSTKINQYVQSITSLMTTKYKNDAKNTEAGLKSVLAGKERVLSVGKILQSAISTQDADSASVLVLHTKTTQGALSGESVGRTTVSLRKVGGQWLVDNAVDYAVASGTGGSK
jgi:hypothetical protein